MGFRTTRGLRGRRTAPANSRIYIANVYSVVRSVGNVSQDAFVGRLAPRYIVLCTAHRPPVRKAGNRSSHPVETPRPPDRLSRNCPTHGSRRSRQPQDSVRRMCRPLPAPSLTRDTTQDGTPSSLESRAGHGLTTGRGFTAERGNPPLQNGCSPCPALPYMDGPTAVPCCARPARPTHTETLTDTPRTVPDH